MESQPALDTNRLVLRPFVPEDAGRVEMLAGDKRIADVTANIPHPYSEGMGKTWISGLSENWQNREIATFAITLKETRLLIGCISLKNISNAEGELGYWVGVPYWGHGYCSEACIAIVEFGIERLILKRIHGNHLSRNPASGKVLINAGLVHIGSGETECGYRNHRESIELYEKVFT